jgi:hypothetical protein
MQTDFVAGLCRWVILISRKFEIFTTFSQINWKAIAFAATHTVR